MADLSGPATIGLAAISAGAVAYALVVPLLAKRGQAEKRKKSLLESRTGRTKESSANRRDQVAQALKDLDARENSSKVTLEARLAHAGLDWTKRKFHLASAALGLVLAGLAYVLSENPWLALGAGFSGGLGLPRWILEFLAKRRIGKFVIELPNAIDVVVRGIRAGLPVADCMRIIAREAQEPVRSEFRQIVETQALGVSLGDACAKLYDRVPVAEASFFAIVIGIQQKSGGNLSEALSGLSRVLRERRKMAGKIQAMSMEAKASAAIIGALPFIVALLTYLSSPQYIMLLFTTQAGKVALLGAGIWMAMGIFTMRRMIRFDI